MQIQVFLVLALTIVVIMVLFNTFLIHEMGTDYDEDFEYDEMGRKHVLMEMEETLKKDSASLLQMKHFYFMGGTQNDSKFCVPNLRRLKNGGIRNNTG